MLVPLETRLVILGINEMDRNEKPIHAT